MLFNSKITKLFVPEQNTGAPVQTKLPLDPVASKYCEQIFSDEALSESKVVPAYTELTEKPVKAGNDVTSISYFQRGTTENFIMSTSKILMERTGLGTRPL